MQEQVGLYSQSNDEECQRKHVHLSHTGDASEMRLTWITKGWNCKSSVKYRRSMWSSSEQYGFFSGLSCMFFSCTADGSKLTYHANDACNDPAKSNDDSPTYMHTSVLSKLQPGRKQYWYQIESGGQKTYFRSPQSNAAESQLSFLVYGDMGSPTAKKCPGARGTLASLLNETAKVDMIIHIGDISYADGSSSIWDDFMEAIEPISEKVPYMVTVGNHEYDWLPTKDDVRQGVVDASGVSRPYTPEWGNYGEDSRGECGYALSDRFIMPRGIKKLGKLPLANQPFWYHMESGPVSFIALSSEHDLTEDSDQRQVCLQQKMR